MRRILAGVLAALSTLPLLSASAAETVQREPYGIGLEALPIPTLFTCCRL
jgi:hypothetical protein